MLHDLISSQKNLIKLEDSNENEEKLSIFFIKTI